MTAPGYNTATLLGNGQVLVARTRNGTADLYTQHRQVQDVVWSSNNTTVATINQAGIATGIGTGMTTITATSSSISGSTSLVGNQPPTANAGSNQIVNEGSRVTLTGSGIDPDGTIASYVWTQTAGAPVALYSANTATASFTAPPVVADTILTFQLYVTDNNVATASAITNVTVKKVISLCDLVVTAISSTEPTIKRGRFITITATTANLGNIATTVASSTGLYLSTDSTITTSDTLVGSFSNVSLTGGSSQSPAVRFPVPNTLTRGTYYLGAIADYTGVQAENNENNNSFTGVTIQVK